MRFLWSLPRTVVWLIFICNVLAVGVFSLMALRSEHLAGVQLLQVLFFGCVCMTAATWCLHRLYRINGKAS
ncbi:MAG: hypothetical protein U0520_05310 [Candidatus Saccharimonadales bacterium]